MWMPIMCYSRSVQICDGYPKSGSSIADAFACVRHPDITVAEDSTQSVE